MNNLQAHTLPLFGKHLIEASAGTGKTYNITRIYLRLLLERKLTVDQILVMTFTKDATEEIKGRIDGFIRDALSQWQTLALEDDLFKELSKTITFDEASFLLNRALLFLDEAAIFTIHGFCKRVLSQHAFVSGVSFNAQMETDCKDLIEEACQDWYRQLAVITPDDFMMLASFWKTPDSFLKNFQKAINQTSAITIVTQEQIETEFLNSVRQAIFDLEQNADLLENALILVKKGAAQQLRRDELKELFDWLNNVIEDLDYLKNPMPTAFFNGLRYKSSPEKSRLLSAFDSVKALKLASGKIKGSIEKAKAFLIVRTGILSIREKLKNKKEQQAVLSFDDLISTLGTKLTQEPKLAEVLFEQYPAALVDEFQDTDPLQFSILQSIYYHQAQATLYLIGDPKQAIYGFRGGDVFAYLSARSGCEYQWLMDTNWRSSKEMIHAYNRLFYGEALDWHEDNSAIENSALDRSALQTLKPSARVFGYGIEYQPVLPSPAAKVGKFYETELHQQAMQFIHFTPDETTASGNVAQSFRPKMAAWCADEIGTLLANSELQAQDIAILVRDGTEAAAIYSALQDNSLSAVFLSNRANLFHSEQAQQLLLVLKAILFLENDRFFIAGLASALLDFAPKKLNAIQLDDLRWQQQKHAFSALRQIWLSRGFIAMALKVMHEHFAINIEDKDRVLTNLLHLFELLQNASQRFRQPQELLFWFEQQIVAERPESEAELRLESDDNLIKIVTQHGAKGLEYPVVFVPFVTRHKDPLKFGTQNVNLIEYHDKYGELVISLDGDKDAKKAMADEAYAEAIRLLYVAVTRAEQRCYLLTTAFDKCHLSPLGRTLGWQEDQDIAASLKGLAADNSQTIAFREFSGNEASTGFVLNAEAKPDICVAKFESHIERDWWLSSFSALSRNLRNRGTSLPDRDNDLIKESGPLSQNGSDFGSLRFSITKGAQTGNLLHDILEHLDFQQPKWSQAFKWPLAKYSQAEINEEKLQAWFEDILKAPLTFGNTLSDIATDKTLRESEFYFPMNASNSAELTKMLSNHRVQEAKGSSGRSSVHLPGYKKLKGMMHGFIDLIFEHDGKYYVADYKSNFLGESFEQYNEEAMRDNIEEHFYDLQYLIYALALHRQLQFLIPNYSVEQNFGGVYYFYLRGMTADTNYRGSGVYHRQITEAELTTLDSLFKEGEH